MTQLPTLYKYASNGKLQQWSIVTSGGAFYTVEGLVSGTLTTSKLTQCKPKNVGRANATTADQQALLEAKAKWQKKLDSGYNEVPSKEAKFFAPMLAHKLEDYEHLLFTGPTYIQPKLDGIRCISADNKLSTRNGKPITACPHLHQSISMLDGELYSHQYRDNFNKIVSLVKKVKPTTEELDEAKSAIRFWVYDVPSVHGVYTKRLARLEELVSEVNRELGYDPVNGPYKAVPTYRVASAKDIENCHMQFLEEGFEGSIIRIDFGPYENKRSKQLLKKKDWKDEEFKIIGWQEGEGGRTGTIGYFVCETADGKVFNSNVKGDFEYLAQVLQDADKYIGTMATIKYFNLTPDGIPRFPYIIQLDRSSYE